MGLAEKRAIAAVQEKEFPGLKKAVEKAAGFPVAIDMKWDTLTVEGKGDLYAATFKKMYFDPLCDALTAITADKMGKDALKGSLKKVVIDGSEGFHSGHYTYDGGVLTIKNEPFSNLDDVTERTDGIRKLIEAKL